MPHSAGPVGTAWWPHSSLHRSASVLCMEGGGQRMKHKVELCIYTHTQFRISMYIYVYTYSHIHMCTCTQLCISIFFAVRRTQRVITVDVCTCMHMARHMYAACCLLADSRFMGSQRRNISHLSSYLSICLAVYPSLHLSIYLLSVYSGTCIYARIYSYIYIFIYPTCCVLT